MKYFKATSILFAYCVIALSGCASVPHSANSALSEEKVRVFIHKISNDMERMDIKELASNYSTNFVYEDNVSTSHSIRWGYKQYLQYAANLMGRASKVESKTAIKNISIKGDSSASVEIQQTTRVTFQGKTQEIRSIQRSKIIQKNGKLLILHIKMLEDLGHEVL